MKFKFLIIIPFVFTLGCALSDKKNKKGQKAKIMLLRTFHFSNPGNDLVKNKVNNVMSRSSQVYLEKLSQKIANLKPTKILLEYSSKENTKTNSRLTKYLSGNQCYNPIAFT